MTAHPEQSIKRLRKRLDESEDIASDDAAALRDMSNQIRLLGPSEYSDFAHEKYLMRAVKLAEEVGGLADALEDRDAAENLVTWINTEQTNSPETNKDYRVTLRQFGKLASDGDDIPESLEWVPGGYPKNYDPAPDPGDMLLWEEDILPMVEACNNLRDQAIITLAWDLGPRPYELFDLTVGQFADHKYGLQVTVDGKTGRRSPVLIPSVPYVKRWLDVHPGQGDPSAPFICRKTSPTEISNNRVRDILKEKARKADVKKGVTPSVFRKSSASHLASQGVSQAHLEDHHGWTRGSDIAARYIAVFGDANDREIAKAHGIDVEEDSPDPTAPIICPRCGEKTPRERDWCLNCNQSLDLEAQELLNQVKGKFDDRLVESDDPDERRDFVRARRTLEEKPGVMDKSELHDLASRLED